MAEMNGCNVMETMCARALVDSVEAAKLKLHEFDALRDGSGEVAIGAMHVAKGLEFKAVVVMVCDDEKSGSLA
jgi:superfamily I DNA/RNA helicase